MSTQDEKAEQSRVKLVREVAESKNKMRENWPVILDILENQATERRARYQASLKAGFSEEQALRLCMVA